MAVSRTSADHAAHDELMLAVFASGDDLPAEDLARVEAQVRDCAQCALVVADLRAIQAATVALPTPPRRRDFRLTEADAARLHQGRWRRFLAALGSPRDRISGPAAAGLATIGVAGILFVGVSGMSGTTQAPTVTSAIQPIGGGAVSGGGAAVPEAAGLASPAADQMTTRSEMAVPSDAKVAPQVPPASAGPVMGAEVPGGAGQAVPAESAGPVTLVAPDAGSPAVGGAEPGDAGIAQTEIQPVTPADVPVPSPAPGGPEPAVIVGLLSVVALAAGLVLAGLRLAGRRIASRDQGG
jgi:hypothetical protein